MRISLKRHSRLLTVAVAVALGAVLGILLGPRLMTGSGAEEEHANAGGDLEQPQEEHQEGLVRLSAESRRTAGIRVVAAGPGTVEGFIWAPGVVRANQNHAATVIPTTPGVLSAVKANIGDRVLRGQTLAILRSSELAQAQADLEQAKREFELARDAHERTRKLAEAGAFSQPPTEDAAEAVSEAAQAVEEAQAAVDDNTEKVRVAERRLQRAKEAIDLGSIGQEAIEDAQRDHDDAVEADKSAKAELTRAESELRRDQGLVEPGLTTQRELDEARKDVTTARAALDRAGKQREIARAKLDRARQLVVQDIPTGNAVDAARQDLVEAQQALEAVTARLREAQRRHDIAQQRLEREKKVLDQDLLAAQALAQTERELRVAESVLKAAEDTVRILSQGRADGGGTVAIAAPVSGTIVERDARVGQVVDSESVLFEIANIRSVFVEASLYEQDVAAVRRGQTMLVSVQAYPNIQFEGVVDSIDPVLDSEAKKVLVRALMPNPEGRLMPGMFAEVRLHVSSVAADLTIPDTALESDEDQEYVFIERAPSRFEKRLVTVGRRGRERVEILEGIEPGDKVVAEGSFFLKSELVKESFEASDGH